MALFGFGGGVVGGATVRLLLDDSQFKRGLAEAEAETKAASSTMGKFGGIAKQGFLIAGAAAGAFAVASVKSFMEHEAVMTEFQNTLEKMPQLAGETTKAFEEQATALQNLTGYQDEEIISADNILARFKLTGEQIREAIPIVLDYARATGTEVPAAAQNIGKALLGNTRALKSVGIEFTATGNTAQDFTKILSLMEGKVGGTAEAFGGTLAGQLEIAKAKFDDVMEEVGRALIPALTSLLRAVEPVIQAFAALAPHVVELGIAFVGLKALSSWLPALLLRVSSLMAGLGTGAAANSVLRFGDALRMLPLPLAAIATALGAAAVILQNMHHTSLPEVANDMARLGEDSEVVHQELGKIYTGGKGASLVMEHFLANAADKARDSLTHAAGAAVSLVYADQQLASNQRTLSPALDAVFRSLWAQKHAAEEDAAAHDRLAEAARNLRTQDQILAGGALGVVAAFQQAQESQKEVTRLREAGKVGTQKYSAAVLQALNDELSFKSALDQQNATARQTANSNDRLAGTLQAVGAHAGVTRGDISSLLGVLSGASNEGRSLNQQLDALDGRTVDINVVTHYSSTGTPGTAGGIQK